MIVVLSPAKSLDFTTPPTVAAHTQPDFLDQSQVLVDRLRQLPPLAISELMGVSGALAVLNAERYASWHRPFTPENAKQAILAFNGDVYEGLNAPTLSPAALDFAQSHVRILSGLYGVLRPLDLMMPYRLEMGTRLDNSRGKDLYQFWGEVITLHLNEALAAQGDEVLINLASDEYFKSVRPKALKGRIVTPVFKDEKNGQFKIISFYAKKARGMMARHIIKHRLTEVTQLTGFNEAGYYFVPEESDDRTLMFKRAEN